MEVTFWGVRTGAGLIVNGFLRDISDRNRLLELQSRLASIVQSSDDAIVGMTPDCRITSWNPGAEQLYGYRADEVMGRSVGMLLPTGSADQPSALERVAARRADLVTSPSERLLAEVGPSWLAGKPVRVVRLPIAPREIAPGSTPDRAPPVVLYVGRLEPLKAPELLVEAAARLGSELEVVFVGRSAAARDGKP